MAIIAIAVGLRNRDPICLNATCIVPKHPPKALLHERAQGFRSLGERDGRRFGEHFPPGKLEGEGKVSILGQRVRRVTAQPDERLPAPCADRA